MNAYCPKCKEQRMKGSGNCFIKVDGKEPKLPHPSIRCNKCDSMLEEGVIDDK